MGNLIFQYKTQFRGVLAYLCASVWIQPLVPHMKNEGTHTHFFTIHKSHCSTHICIYILSLAIFIILCDCSFGATIDVRLCIHIKTNCSTLTSCRSLGLNLCQVLLTISGNKQWFNRRALAEHPPRQTGQMFSRATSHLLSEVRTSNLLWCVLCESQPWMWRNCSSKF